MKHLHKFFSKQDLSWVKIIWDRYYKNDKLPRKTNRGSFWWKRVTKLRNIFKGIANAQLGSGDTILFWEDMWNGHIMKISYPELHSFGIDGHVSVKTMLSVDTLHSMFHLPLSIQDFCLRIVVKYFEWERGKHDDARSISRQEHDEFLYWFRSSGE
jgi:hypothetical protein